MTEYLEGDLSEDEQKLFDSHFTDCPPCRDFFESFKTSIDLVEYLKKEECPQAVKKRLDSLINIRLEKSGAS